MSTGDKVETSTVNAQQANDGLNGLGSKKSASAEDVNVFGFGGRTEQSEKDVYDPSKESRWTRLGVTAESFKRAPGSTGQLVVHGNVPPEFVTGDNPLLQQRLKPRHLTMIAVGGSIGTGLFVGSGTALTKGGPAAVVIAWIIMGFMLVLVTQAMGEMAILYPVSGGFYTLASRMIDQSFAFAMGWNYVLQWAVCLPLEITIAASLVQYWTDAVPVGVWLTMFFLLIILVSAFGTLGYAEEEFWSACIKLTLVVVFIITTIVCICGGGPADGQYSKYIGGKYWQDPGPFANGFHGLCAMFVTAAFSFAGTELVGLAATETPNPRKAVPTAIKQTFWRILIIYISTLTVIGLALPYNDPDLFGAGGNNVSPFTLVMKRAGIKGMDHLVNTVICLSVFSIGLASVFAGSRTLTALAETGYAPKIFAFVDKAGRPLYSTLFVLAFGLISYVNLADVGSAVFDWLLALSGLATLFTWLSICVTHIRFRRAWKVQGHSVDELPFKAVAGVWGSWIAATLLVLVIIAQFYIGLYPIGGVESEGERIENFFLAYLAMPVMLAFWIIGFLWKRTVPWRAHEIDLDTGRKSWLTVDEMDEYRAQRKRAPIYVRVFRVLFTSS